MSKYISYKRIKEKVLCGEVNIPANTYLEEYKNIVIYNNQPICSIYSEVFHQHITINDDGRGLERGKLIEDIKKYSHKKKNAINKLTSDPICLKYKRKEHEDYWLWNHEFHIAPIEDLEHILKVIKG